MQLSGESFSLQNKAVEQLFLFSPEKIGSAKDCCIHKQKHEQVKKSSIGEKATVPEKIKEEQVMR